MKHGAWNVVWEVVLCDDEYESGCTVRLATYRDAEQAAKFALNHPKAPSVSVQMALYKDEWMDRVK